LGWFESVEICVFEPGHGEYRSDADHSVAEKYLRHEDVFCISAIQRILNFHHMSATWLREVRDFNKFFTTASNFPSISNFKIFEIRSNGIRSRLDDLTKNWTDWHLPFSEAIPQDKPILLAEASL